MGKTPDAYDECARCGKFYYTHEAQELSRKERHAFTPRDFGEGATPMKTEQVIRADERAKVEREVVAFLLRRTRVRGLFQSVASILEELQRGEHRPNPGQPKEGE